MDQYLVLTKVCLTADAELDAAEGLVLLLGDTQYGDIEVTLPEWSADLGIIIARKLRALNTFSLDLNSSTINGHAGPLELEGLGDSVMLIPGTVSGELILFEPLAL